MYWEEEIPSNIPQGKINLGNHKIAHYMGHIESEKSYYYKGVYYGLSSLKYHKSFEWLMPVVIKLESEGYEIDIFGNCVEVCSLPDEEYVLEKIGKTKVEAIWYAVVDLIDIIENQNNDNQLKPVDEYEEELMRLASKCKVYTYTPEENLEIHKNLNSGLNEFLLEQTNRESNPFHDLKGILIRNYGKNVGDITNLAWEIYCRDTKGAMSAVDFWYELTHDIQVYYHKRAVREIIMSLKPEIRERIYHEEFSVERAVFLYNKDIGNIHVVAVPKTAYNIEIEYDYQLIWLVDTNNIRFSDASVLYKGKHEILGLYPDIPNLIKEFIDLEIPITPNVFNYVIIKSELL